MNLSNNRIGEKAGKRLLQILKDYAVKIEKLELENTQLSSQIFRKLMEALEDHKTLADLNISRNKIDEK